MKKLIFFLMILSVNAIFSISKYKTGRISQFEGTLCGISEENKIKNSVCYGPYQLFEDFSDFNKPFIIDSQFIKYPNIFLTNKTIDTNYRISNLLKLEWYDLKRITYFFETEGRQEKIELENSGNLNIPAFMKEKKIEQLCFGKSLKQISLEMNLKIKEIPTAEVFDPRIMHALYTQLKFGDQQKRGIVSRVSLGKPSSYAGLGALTLINAEPPESTIMRLEPSTIIRLIEYIQSAYVYRAIISEDEEKWLKKKKIYDFFQFKYNNIEELTQKILENNNIISKTLFTDVDKVMLQKLNDVIIAINEAKQIWEAIRLISDISEKCEEFTKEQGIAAAAA